MGETFKYEGDKLTHFTNALSVAKANPENLKRVLVVSLAEGETVPAKGVKIEETYYIPEFTILTKPSTDKKSDGKGGRNQRGGKGRGPKESPWGLSPEEKAAKKNPNKA